MANKDNTTPLMKQYNEIKAKYPDAILLYRVGDFYETFGQDAIDTSKILDIVLTRRAGTGQEHLAGFPYHALDSYLPKFIKAGRRVAICEQVEDPKMVKGIVKRDVTEMVTPGVSYGSAIDQGKDNNFLCSLHKKKDAYGIAFIDITTGEFYVSQSTKEDIAKLLQNFQPKEIVLQRHTERDLAELSKEQILTKTYDDWVFNENFARDVLNSAFGVASMKGFGIEDMPLAIIAAGAAIHYIQETNHNELSHISNISRIDNNNYVWLDRFTIRNLELVDSPNTPQATLYSVLNKTQSNMGARLLKHWILLPLKDKKQIESRQNIVTSLIYDDDLREIIQDNIRIIGDMERLISRLSFHRIQPNELYRFVEVLECIETIQEALSKSKDQSLFPQLDNCPQMKELILNAINDEAPNNISKGNAIKEGYNAELDQYRNIAYNSQQILDDICRKQAELTGISSLKIGYNNVFGYYLEVTNTHKDKVPQNWVRKQTLAQAERYIIEELKDVETKILAAREEIASLETRLYHEVIELCMPYLQRLSLSASSLAQLDCLSCFASCAILNSYTRPVLYENDMLHISKGRHPVIEKLLPIGQQYVANDVYLDTTTQQIVILTGPNMSGKSAYLRQTALIVLMAQIGCYVPAKSAEIGIVDKIFTRVGASDNISSGESTFMVEMNETASILNNLSPHSLILLDEIGRGTSTYDGVSIAWAIAAYIHEAKQRAKVLFATHYHELIAMQKQYDRIKNYHIAVKEVGSKIMFVRTIEQGGSEKSFGIHVAKLAGMPKSVLNLSQQILENLEKDRKNPTSKDQKMDKIAPKTPIQTSFIQLEDPILLQLKDDLLNLDIENLTPLQALNKLNEIKKILQKV